jgi:monooxygenase
LEHLDVLIVGAGLSGVGAAHHLQERCPGRSYAILEGRPRTGGTWDLFRYPGIRSDSDMYTLGYSFRPWEEATAIADGPSILSYVRSTAQEAGIDRHIRLSHRVVRADWSSEDSRWTVTVQRTDTGESTEISASFLLMCTGYYRYEEGYTPDFQGVERFGGPVVHPQHWPQDLDCTGRRVIVIGSGATAITLVPALARDASHVTMLQRSPSYVVSLPAEDAIANSLRRLLPSKLAYALVRWKNVLSTMLTFQLSRRRPSVVKRFIRRRLEEELPAGYDLDTHFKPTYDPWDQLVCLVPDGDLFTAIRSGSASVVTDSIDTFTKTGIRLSSGEELEADVIVTATGLQIQMFGGMELVVDGEPVDMATRMAYKGMMFGGVPNLAMTFGYTNASWTLKCDLTCEYVCRLLRHMDARGHAVCEPRNRDPSIIGQPFMDFSSGYVQRALPTLPKQGPSTPWRLHQNYALDILTLRYSDIEDGEIVFSRSPERAAA